MIKAIIFDLDNTLTDFQKFKKAAVEGAVEAMLDAGLKGDREKMIEKIFQVYGKEGIEDQQVFDKFLEKESGSIDYKILAAGIIGYRKAKDGAMALYPRVRLTLTELVKKGIKMVIVSDAPRLPAWMRICSLGLQHYFDHVLTCDDTGVKKPSSIPFEMALSLLKIKPQQAIMVGDWVERDIEGAKKLGIKTAFARYGDSFGTAASGADYDLDDISSLLGIIDKENGK